MAVGRISGPLLKDNLLRNGVNLAFETNLLYLDVVNSRVGINTATPSNDLQVVGTTRSTNLTATTQAQMASFTVSGNTIASSNSTINLVPNNGNGVVYQGTILVGQFSITGSTISATGTNTNINITPTGTGSTVINSNTLINGNLHATGTITADGNISLGDAATDTIQFVGEVNSDIIPSATNTYNLGSSVLQWNTLYANSLNISNTLTIPTLNTSTLNVGNLVLSGNTITTASADTDINLTTTGSGGVVLGNFRIFNNTITNTVANSNTVFTQAGTGYVVLQGTNGVVIPTGTTGQRPAFPETGMIRFNTDFGYLETFNSVTLEWMPAGSTAGGGLTYSEVEQMSIASALIFG